MVSIIIVECVFQMDSALLKQPLKGAKAKMVSANMIKWTQC